MSESILDAVPAVEAGWSALTRGEWQLARTCLTSAVERSEDPRAYEGLGWAAWWCNDDVAVFAARERAFALYRRQHDVVSAARVAIWLGCDYHDFRGAYAVANGWYQRAHRLLSDAPLSAEHGWLAFQQGAYALELDDDTITARARAREVAGIAAELGHDDLEFLGLALDGLALVTEGDVDEGMRRLDEVGVAATAGEFQEPLATTWSLCYLIYGCERARDFDRASQWCDRMHEVSTRYAFDFGMGVCRAHYGGVLVHRGQWQAAEDELTAAGELLARSRPLAIGEYGVRLGELRRRQGRLDEAAALFDTSMPHPLAVIGLAQIAIERGDAATAVDMVDDLLAATPAANLSQRAEALETLACGRAALGDAGGAAAAASALRSIAETVRTQPLLAMAASAEATAATATGDHESARRHLAEAVVIFDRCGLPYEADCARIELAETLVRLARPEAADGHARGAERRLRLLGALYAAQRAARFARALRADPSSPLAVLSARELEVAALLADGHSDREVAERLHISPHTVHSHVKQIYRQFAVGSRPELMAFFIDHAVISRTQ